MPVDPMSIVGGGIGIVNSLVNAFKGIKQRKDGKKIQEKLDITGTACCCLGIGGT